MDKTKSNAESRGNSVLGMQFRTCENFGESTDSSLDSAESQNQNQNNPRVSANLESRPLRGAKNRNQASSSGKADFLLEADKRGSPPKSEKAAAFWGHNKKELGGAGRGVQPFLREKTGENNSEENAESRLDSAPLPKNTKIRSIIVGANGLSLGISIVVAIMLGVGAGILMQKIFKVAWVLFLGVFWGIAAAVLNVYKVYKAELRDFEKLANDPKYKY